ncbi:hypothetical protein ABIA22_001776 [Sinorhizobium fredii]|uniref:hypothetical protein n=1 Tax=Rhizobium fredii TaxID=380 RepID=UPI0035170019
MNTPYSSTTEGFDSPPAIPRDLVIWLKTQFPNSLPGNINISDRELGALFGEQQVIAHLESILQQQEEDILHNVPT